MPNKTISVPDDVLPVIESLDVPFSYWVTDQLRRSIESISTSVVPVWRQAPLGIVMERFESSRHELLVRGARVLIRVDDPIEMADQPTKKDRQRLLDCSEMSLVGQRALAALPVG